METTTLYENGDTFKIAYKRATKKEPNKDYIFIDEVLHEVISKIKTNDFNVNEMNDKVRERINSHIITQ